VRHQDGRQPGQVENDPGEGRCQHHRRRRPADHTLLLFLQLQLQLPLQLLLRLRVRACAAARHGRQEGRAVVVLGLVALVYLGAGQEKVCFLVGVVPGLAQGCGRADAQGIGVAGGPWITGIGVAHARVLDRAKEEDDRRVKVTNFFFLL